MTTFAELQVWHFMIICNGLTSGYTLYNSVFEKRNESADVIEARWLTESQKWPEEGAILSLKLTRR